MTSEERVRNNYMLMVNELVAQLRQKGVPEETMLCCVDWYLDPKTQLPMRPEPTEMFLMLGVLNRLLHFGLVALTEEKPKIVLVQ